MEFVVKKNLANNQTKHYNKYIKGATDKRLANNDVTKSNRYTMAIGRRLLFC